MKAMAWTLVTGPTVEPVSLPALKEHLRVDATDEDALLEDYLQAARAWAETYTGRALLTQTWDVHYAGWPGLAGFELPLAPLQSITHIKYTVQGAAAATTLTASVYKALVDLESPRVVLAYNQEWPSDTLEDYLPIVVRMVCGWTSAAAVPAGIKQGIRWIVGHMHENREAVTVGNVVPQQVPMSARWALDPYRLHYVW